MPKLKSVGKERIEALDKPALLGIRSAYNSAYRSNRMADLELFKRQAAEHALAYIQSGMILGLGTGSTATHMLHVLAQALRDGRLRDIVGVPTSDAIGALARQLGVPT